MLLSERIMKSALLRLLPLAFLVGGCSSSCGRTSADEGDPSASSAGPAEPENAEVKPTPTMRPAPMPMNDGIRRMNSLPRPDPATRSDATP